VGPVGSENKNECADEAQQQFTRPPIQRPCAVNESLNNECGIVNGIIIGKRNRSNQGNQ
jgi:hypothetical protein